LLTEPTPTTETAPAANEGTLSRPMPVPLVPGLELPPDSLRYRLKNKLLGPPLHTEQLEDERLGKPTALAVFASDNLSSSAYATEEMLRVLIPIIGLGAFALVVPITTALLVVLFFLILSYRQTIKAYPTAGGAYMVTRDNFGLMPAQVAGVALLTDYVLTVSVSVAAGTAALASAFPMFDRWILWISIAFVIIIAWGNLRGVRESGKLFAVPTYFFIVNMGILISVGVFKAFHGGLARANYAHATGLMHVGNKGTGLLAGASLALVLHSFASGGAAVTGVEAISNGVPAFKKPEWKNARDTLVIMGSLLGVMFIGLSIMDAKMHVIPFELGTPTVISQIGKLAYGGGLSGNILYYCLQAGTMLILVLAANTSFADFPRLASFHAGDNFMPRQLTKRGHRLVFSNGIIFLAIAAIVLLLATDAKVDRLIPLYAIGVFTSFTLSQAGMAKHHIREKEQGWRWGLFVNGFGAFLSFVVDIVIAIFKFERGAWVIVVFVPIMVFFLVRLAKQYKTEDDALAHDVPKAVAAPVRKRLVVMVFVDRLDLAVARAMQFGRALRPDELRAVHFVIDQHQADDLAAEWREHGLTNLGLELIDCPDRRLTRSARAELRRLGGLRAVARAQVQRRLAPDPPRPDGRVALPGDLASAPRQRDDRAVPLRRPGHDRRHDRHRAAGVDQRQRARIEQRKRSEQRERQGQERGQVPLRHRDHQPAAGDDGDRRGPLPPEREGARTGPGDPGRAARRQPEPRVHAGRRDRWGVGRVLRPQADRRHQHRLDRHRRRDGDRPPRSARDRQPALRTALTHYSSRRRRATMAG